MTSLWYLARSDWWEWAERTCWSTAEIRSSTCAANYDTVLSQALYGMDKYDYSSSVLIWLQAGDIKSSGWGCVPTSSIKKKKKKKAFLPDNGRTVDLGSWVGEECGAVEERGSVTDIKSVKLANEVVRPQAHKNKNAAGEELESFLAMWVGWILRSIGLFRHSDSSSKYLLFFGMDWADFLDGLSRKGVFVQLHQFGEFLISVGFMIGGFGQRRLLLHEILMIPSFYF